MTPAQRTRARATARAAAGSPAAHGIAGGTSAAIVLVWALDQAGIQMPLEVAQALTGLAIATVGALTAAVSRRARRG